MHLSRVVLTRGNQELILQGMIHVAPDSLYDILQGDIDRATQDNYQIFFEGVNKHPAKKVATINEGKIKKHLILIAHLYPVVAKALGLSLQKEKIKYPEDAINADISFSELIEKLDKNGFKCDFLLWLLGMVSKKELKKIIEESCSKQNGVNVFENRDKWSLARLFLWFYFRKAKPIILDYRNQIAVTKVEQCAPGRNAFVHYGEKHIKGLVRLFQGTDWVVKERTYQKIAHYYQVK